MVAIPLLTEVGGRAAYPWLQRIVVVDLPEAMQLTRLQARDAISAQLAQQMLAAQATRSQRLALADDVIDNSGDLAALDAQVQVPIGRASGRARGGKYGEIPVGAVPLKKKK